MKKGHSAFFHNAWDPKNILIEKSIFNTPQTRKTNTFIEKTVRVLKPYLPTAWNLECHQNQDSAKSWKKQFFQLLFK